MSTSSKILLTAAIVGGVCGLIGAALYMSCRASRRTAADRASAILHQLEAVADRIEQTLGPVSEPLPG